MQINVVEFLKRGALVACPHKTTIDALMQQAGLTVDQVDYFERMPTNIVENFGNASGATIPTNITKQTSIILRKIYT